MNDNEKEYLVNEINKEIDNAIKRNEFLRATYMQLMKKEEEILAERQKLEVEATKVLADLRMSNALLLELCSVFNEFEHNNEIDITKAFNKILNLVALSKTISERKINMLGQNTKDD
ncbi:MAG: hypothetical protein QXS81_01325 [Candidatus Micrarchaeaceae archaeon]